MKNIIVKIITFTFLLSFNTLLACTGDCFTCHPTLLNNIDKDERHLAMKTCKKCHKANPESMAECGADCFGCHTKEKLQNKGIKEHIVIEECRYCHMKMKKEKEINLFDDGTESSTLKDFLF